MNYEIGARGQPVPSVSYSVALFLGRVSDAIVQGPEIGGRAFFRNAGKTHNDGAELGLNVSPTAGLTLRGSYTYARYRFTDYQLADGTSWTGTGFLACRSTSGALGSAPLCPRISSSMPTTPSARRS